MGVVLTSTRRQPKLTSIPIGQVVGCLGGGGSLSSSEEAGRQLWGSVTSGPARCPLCASSVKADGGGLSLENRSSPGGVRFCVRCLAHTSEGGLLSCKVSL